MQEPAKPAETNKPQASTFDTGSLGSGGKDQSLGEVKLMTRNTQLNGDRTRSFREPNENDLAEFNYFLERPFVVTRRFQMLSMFRSTDDQSIDPEINSVQKFYVRVFGPKDEYIVGDALVNYSTLSFNQNIKGISSSWKFNPQWKFSIVGGAYIDRWGSLYKDLPGRPYAGIVSGARLEYKVDKTTTVGMNWASDDDQINTLPFSLAGSGIAPLRNRVGSIDERISWGAFRLSSEYAWSFTNFDLRANGCLSLPCDSRTPTAGVGYQSDWGSRLDGSWKHKRWTLRGSFIRYQPNFASVNARQVPDLQDVVFRTTYELTDFLTLDGTMRRSNDDLRGQKPFETRLWGPEGKLVFSNLAFYKRGVFEVGYRDRIVNSLEDFFIKSNPATANQVIDRFTRGPFADFTVPIKTTFFTLGWEHRQAEDFINQANSTNTNRVYAGLRGIYDIHGWHVSPNFRFELERQSQRANLANAALAPQIAMFLDYGSNRLDSLSLMTEAPKYFILELAYRNSSATLSQLDPTNSFFVPSGFSRPSYRASLTYKYRNDENTEAIFFFERYNNYYFTQTNYDERVVGVTLIYKFGRRGR